MHFHVPKKGLHRHLLYWAGVTLFFPVMEFSSSGLLWDKEMARLYWDNFIFESLPTYLFFTYLLLGRVVPSFLGKRYLQSTVALLLLFLASALVQKICFEIDYYFIQPLSLGPPSGMDFKLSFVADDLVDWKEWVNLTYDFALVGFVPAAIKIYNDWLGRQRENDRLEKQKLRTELQLIKTRINPGFLFGTLEGLHLLTLEKSRMAPAAVLKLADLLGYMIYDSRADEVMLEMEVGMLKDYIFLAGAILPGKVDVSETFAGDLFGKKIVPLLLLPLLENSFRHCSGAGVEQAWISLQLEVEQGMVKFRLINSTVPKRIGSAVEEGRGLRDLRRQLEQFYKNRHTLKLVHGEDTFMVSLVLQLNKTNQEKFDKHNINDPHETSMPDSR